MCSKFSFVLVTEYLSRYIKLVLFEDYNNTIQSDMRQLLWLTVVPWTTRLQECSTNDKDVSSVYFLKTVAICEGNAIENRRNVSPADWNETFIGSGNDPANVKSLLYNYCSENPFLVSFIWTIWGGKGITSRKNIWGSLFR